VLGLADRVALVTGAAGGIGRATAERLAAEGAAVVVADLDGARCDEVARAIEGAGGRALGCRCDVTSRREAEGAVAAALERWGRLDILVNNAGLVRDAYLFRMTDEDWEQVIAVHLHGAFHCTRAAQAPMVAARFGRIVCTSSISALGLAGQTNYAAAKAGVQGFIRTLALELGPFGITVNAVAPGLIDTPLARRGASLQGITMEELQRRIVPDIPLRRIGQPRDVAAVTAFLCSDDAAYVNGQIVYVRGGP
jgi:3-oxoacyl-[acyl-carrier protein] reductase